MVVLLRVVVLVGVVFFAGAARADRDPDAANVKLLSAPDFRVRVNAALALGETHGTTGRPALEKALAEDQSSSVRSACAAALGHRGDKAAVPALRARLSKETEGQVKTSIETALAKLSS